MRLDFSKRPLSWLFTGGNQSASRPIRIAQGILLALFLAGILFLYEADKPWSGKILEKFESGKKLNLGQYITVGLYCAAILNTFLSALLYATARWWARPFPVASPRTGAWIPGCRKAALAWWTVMLLAVAAAGFLRWNLAHGSLWWDETWNLTRAVHGEWESEPADSSNMVFKPAGWDRTFFYYAKPTNHVLFSVASKFSLTVWQKFTGRDVSEFDEFIFRLPNFLAALAAVAALAFLLRDWGFPAAGLAAAWLLALHPWHIRYGIDARAFSSVTLLSILACFLLVRAVRSGKWKYWLGFGLCHGLLMWSFPYAIYLNLTLGAAAVLLIFTNRASLPRWSMLGRCAVGLTMGAMLFLQLMGPNIAHIPDWVGLAGHGLIDVSFLPEMAGALVAGMPWWDTLNSSGTDGIPNLKTLITKDFPLYGVVLGLLPLLALIGSVGILIRKGLRNPEAITLAAWFLAVPLAIALAWGKSHYFYPRYVIYGLPAFLAAVAIALEILPRLIRHPGARRLLTILLTCGIPLAYLGATTPVRHLLQTRSYSPMREVAAYLKQLDEETPGGIIACGFGLGGDTPRIYNPWIVFAYKREEFLEILERSRNESKPLILFYAYSDFNRANTPEVFPLIDDESLFEKVTEFHGIESQFRHQILRYTGKNPVETE